MGKKGDRKGRLYYERPVLPERVIVETTLAVALLSTTAVAFLLTPAMIHRRCISGKKQLTSNRRRSTIQVFRREKSEQAGFLPVLPIGVIGSCAADVYEPRQVREEATVNGPLWVP